MKRFKWLAGDLYLYVWEQPPEIEAEQRAVSQTEHAEMVIKVTFTTSTYVWSSRRVKQ